MKSAITVSLTTKSSTESNLVTLKITYKLNSTYFFVLLGSFVTFMLGSSLINFYILRSNGS